MATGTYEKVRGYTYKRKAKTITKKGPHNKTETVHLKPEIVHVRPHKASRPKVRKTQITLNRNQDYEFTTESWKKPNAYQTAHLNSSCFLDPSDRKYPIKKQDNGPIYVHALVAAAHYASPSMWDDPPVYKKAHQLLAIYAKSKEGKTRSSSTKRRK